MNQIIQEARELYQRTIKHPEYAKSHIWQDGSENNRYLMHIIGACENQEEVLHMLDKSDMYAIRIHDKETFNLMMDWYKQRFEIFEEYSTTPNLCKMQLYCEKIRATIGDVETIVELGGGNGQFAYMADKFIFNKLHIDIDIPESLYMAYVCTRHRFPDAKCQWINHGDSIDREANFVFIPIGNESILHEGNFDLFVNTASMGELPNETIRYWMDFVQNKINVKYFYGFNRFLNTIEPNASGFSSYRRNENEASVLFDANWKVLEWEVEPLLARCPYEDPKIARYLEIILERQDNSDVVYEKEIEDIGMEDWYRYSDINTVGTHRSNQLVNDMTMDGTLFKLWNAMRIAPCTDYAAMMISYLRHLGRVGLMFEEELFYSKFL